MGGLGYGSHYYHSYFNGVFWAWIIAIILAVILMLTFLSKRNRGNYSGFLAFVYDLLNFNKLTISAVLKFIYLTFAIGYALTTIFGLFSYGFASFLVGLLGLVVGEIFLRIGFEIIMMVVIGVTNLIEINETLRGKKSENRPEFVEPDTDKYAANISEKANEVAKKLKEHKENASKAETAKPIEKVDAEEVAEEPVAPTPKPRKPRAKKVKVEPKPEENQE